MVSVVPFRKKTVHFMRLMYLSILSFEIDIYLKRS